MSLVEVMIALLIMSFGLFPLMGLFVDLVRGAKATGMHTKAAFLAQEYLAGLQAADYSVLDEKIRALAPDTFQANINSEMGSVSALDTDFEWNALLRREEVAGSSRIAIVVTVRWSSVPIAGDVQTKEAIGYVVAP